MLAFQGVLSFHGSSTRQLLMMMMMMMMMFGSWVKWLAWLVLDLEVGWCKLAAEVHLPDHL